MELIIIIAAFALIMLGYKNKKYKQGSYYQITKNSYSSLDKGKRGEYLIYKNLRHLEDNGGKFLFNIYLPKENNQTTEIDALLICPKGIFVFESKNYGGWIFGNEAHKNWTQTFPTGRGSSRKEHFYNPVMQNASHLKHLKRFIGDNIPMWSVIVFSDQCTLKNVTVNSAHVHVTYPHKISSVVTQICSQAKDCLTALEVNDVYNKLWFLTQISDEAKAKHAETTRPYRIST
jgi:hypothetical protein